MSLAVEELFEVIDDRTRRVLELQPDRQEFLNTMAQGAAVIECLALLTRARITRATDGGADEVAADLAAALALARETGATAYEGEIEAERAEVPSGAQ